MHAVEVESTPRDLGAEEPPAPGKGGMRRQTRADATQLPASNPRPDACKHPPTPSPATPRRSPARPSAFPVPMASTSPFAPGPRPISRPPFTEHPRLSRSPATSQASPMESPYAEQAFSGEFLRPRMAKTTLPAPGQCRQRSPEKVRIEEQEPKRSCTLSTPPLSQRDPHISGAYKKVARSISDSYKPALEQLQTPVALNNRTPYSFAEAASTPATTATPPDLSAIPTAHLTATPHAPSAPPAVRRIVTATVASPAPAAARITPIVTATTSIQPPACSSNRRALTANATQSTAYAQTRATTVAVVPSTAAHAQSAAQTAAPDIAAPIPPHTRYPPLVVERFPSWATHFRVLKEKLGRAPNARPFGRGVRFTPTEDREYRLIQSYLTELDKAEKLSWFSYSLPAERSLRVSIRGLPQDTPTQEIEQDLRDLGFEPEYVRPIHARRGRPGCIFLAILKRTENLTPGIYAVNEMLCMPGVKIEAWRGKKGPAQCHRCQKFRHSSHKCNRQQACVRCGEEHAAFQCPRPREEPATCANCGGPHPANHASCPVFKWEIRNKKAGPVAQTAAERTRPRSVSGPRAMGKQQPQETQKLQEPQQRGSLMAAANDPTLRGVPSRRRKKRKKKAESGPLSPEPHPKVDPRPPETAIKEKTEVVTQATASTPPRAPSLMQAEEGGDKPARKLAIQLYIETMQAVGEGGDPLPLIINAFEKLMDYYG